MKKYIIFLVLVTIGFSASAQTRGFYGTLQPFSTFNGSMMTHPGVSAPNSGVDTLRGVDTTYATWGFGKTYFGTFTLVITPYSYDSTTGTAILQASDDNVTWQSITGLTSICTSCVGASKTITNAKGTNKYTWSVGQLTFAYWRIRLVGSRSTDTTVVTSYATYSY